VIAENREEGSFIWENYYDPQTCINEYDLTIFSPVQGPAGDNLYQKSEEVHYQRGYTPEQIRSLIEQAGLIFEKAVDADTHEAVSAKSERVYVYARENGKVKP
jgi:hypothetical protein